MLGYLNQLITTKGQVDFGAFEDDERSPALELDGVGMMDLPNGQSSITTTAATISEKSSSSDSLSDKGSSELKKSFDAVVFDVLKVTPEEYAWRMWRYAIIIVTYYENSKSNNCVDFFQGQITLMDAPVFKAIQPECPLPQRESLMLCLIRIAGPFPDSRHG
ncbi:hypothetical protein F2P81_025845 [Scophthalmus maximus]|uniref:Uncharacterized protein n=1 Tax=Scophthalmus maximus TaxID=52904 RepID=A0A6A4RS99_SCOMX|nr:hypothetical protein F2P81_025845 [Scophthalmus maximus]